MTNKAKKQINEVIYLSPPQEWLYKCDCPKCISGAHFDKEIAESYRKRGELNNEVARLRELLKKVLFELERVPFHTPKLTAFTAHRLADRYRDQFNQIAK